MNNQSEYIKIIKTIKKEIPFVDIKPFSHNIINLELQILSEKFGEDKVKQVISETKLKHLGWGHILDN